MIEKPIPIEFMPIRSAYFRHLDTGEPPNLKDLIQKTPRKYWGVLIDTIIEGYSQAGRVGIHPDFPDFQEKFDSFVVAHYLQREITKSRLRIVEPEKED